MPAREPLAVRHLKAVDTDRRAVKARAVMQAPKCPTWMPRPGRKLWRDTVQYLHADLGVLTALDTAALSGFCASYGRWVQAEQEISEHGILVEGYRGSRVKNPAAQIARDNREAMLKFARELGLTPKAREALTLPLDDPDNDDDLFD